MDAVQALAVQVRSKSLLTPDIALFELVDPEGRPLPAFEAGAHIDVTTPAGKIRQYSLCGRPGTSDRYEIAVLREAAGRGGSRAMHEQVRPGDRLTISPPRNHFPLAPQAQRSLLLAGGIGITPLLAMAHVLAADGRPFDLHYCARTAGHAAFAGTLRAAAFADRVHCHFDDGPPAQRLDLDRRLAAPAPGLHLYVCGPQGFMDAVLASARRQGWDESRLHYEFFKAPEAAPAAADAPFEVVVASTGQAFRVAPGQTVVTALAAHGLAIPTSCEQGVCGTCLTGIVEGVPEHRDLYLTDEEKACNDQFLPCCSRARSPRLVLAL